MNRRDRKQHKKKQRAERLRKAKHFRHSPAGRVPGSELKPGQPDLTVQPADTRTTSPEEKVPANIFATEDARRWLNALCAENVSNPIVDTLDVADYVPDELLLRASVCRELIAAAELVAASRGRPCRQLPRNAIDWLIAKDLVVSPGVVRLALTGIQRVCDHSELKEVWRASGRLSEWLRAMADLQERLRP